MSSPETPHIAPGDLDWGNAEVQEGRSHGAVVSVRLDPDEAARLRSLAESSGLNLSQVLRRALADFDPRPSKTSAARVWQMHTFAASFTYGAGLATALSWSWIPVGQLHLDPTAPRALGGDLTATEPVRIVERVVM